MGFLDSKRENPKIPKENPEIPEGNSSQITGHIDSSVALNNSIYNTDDNNKYARDDMTIKKYCQFN
eukprot:12077932-Ditylum_brightwellii.AAC.1